MFIRRFVHVKTALLNRTIDEGETRYPLVRIRMNTVFHFISSYFSKRRANIFSEHNVYIMHNISIRTFIRKSLIYDVSVVNFVIIYNA